MNASRPTATISAEAALALVQATLEAGAELGFEPAVAVTDAGGALRAFLRADGAPFLTAEIALNKAWTASAFGLPTDAWNVIVGDPKVAPLAHIPRLTAVEGGFPLRKGALVIGGLGVSGGRDGQDAEAARRAMARLGLSDPALAHA